MKTAPPKEVSDFLRDVIKEPVTLSYPKPHDLDSTDSLDSFLDALYVIFNILILH